MKDSTRQRVMTAATQLFLQQGYDLSSMDAIATAAGVAKQTLYNGYPNKQSLFLDAVVFSCQQLTSGLVPYLEQPLPDLRQSLVLLGRHLLQRLLAADALQLYRLMIAENQRLTELEQRFYQTEPWNGFSLLIDFIEQRQDQAELRPGSAKQLTETFTRLLLDQPRLKALFGQRLSWEEQEQWLVFVVDGFIRGWGSERPIG